MMDKYKILSEDDFQKLEEFRVIEGITDESHPLMKIIANSNKILEGQQAMETVEFYKNAGFNKTIAGLNEIIVKLTNNISSFDEDKLVECIVDFSGNGDI